MDLARMQMLAAQIESCGMSRREVQTFVRDFALIRLKEAIGRLRKAEQEDWKREVPRSEAGIDWTDRELQRRSGVEDSWIKDMEDPGTVYLHINTALSGNWKNVSKYLAFTFLSGKQRRVLFPVLSKAKRGGSNEGEIAEEVDRLNKMLYWASHSGMNFEIFGKYQAHLKIHGASQNTGGKIGAMGAVIAFMDALKEISSDVVIKDVAGEPLPDGVRTPMEIYDYLLSFGEEKVGNDKRKRKSKKAKAIGIQAVLFDNGNAIVFSSDPDVAIFRSLGAPYSTAEEALKAWEDVRRDVVGRRHQVHQHVVGEIKTATDSQNLHERLALGNRETREEVRTDRFLMMSILTKDVLGAGEEGGKKRKGAGIANKDVERFSDVFNLYFLWGYDDARKNHPDHWENFKMRLTEWYRFGSR